MKKIAIVIHNTWQGYNFRMNLARALKKAQYDVVFISPFDAKYSPLIAKEFEYHPLYFDAKGINPLNDFKTMLALRKMYKQVAPDLVLNFSIKPNIYSSIVSGIMGIPSVSNITGLGTVFIKEGLVTRIAKGLYKYALHFNRKVFFQNSDDKNLFVKSHLVQEEKIDLLPGSGVDLEKFMPQTPQKKQEKFVFLLIARLLRDKGVLEFIEAVRMLKKRYETIEFQLLGAADFMNQTAISREEVKKWEDEGLVTYLGVSDSVQNVIMHADCVVLPSYREGTPRSLLEACAMEKPIIATDVVGCREVVEDGVNGYLCEVRNAQDLADKMEKMYSLTAEERQRLGQAGREKIIREFDEKIVITKYLETLEEIFKEEHTL